MVDLIRALTIFEKYLRGRKRVVSCDHDVLRVHIHPGNLSERDKDTLEHLGFYADEEEEWFRSYVHGSC